jgi:hypothetical protein
MNTALRDGVDSIDSEQSLVIVRRLICVTRRNALNAWASVEMATCSSSWQCELAARSSMI